MDGTLEMVSKTEDDDTFTPNAINSCFRMIIIPIEVNIPFTTDEGKKSLSFPILKYPNKNIKKPAIVIAAKAYSKPPNELTVCKLTTIKPAAGP